MACPMSAAEVLKAMTQVAFYVAEAMVYLKSGVRVLLVVSFYPPQYCSRLYVRSFSHLFSCFFCVLCGFCVFFLSFLCRSCIVFVSFLGHFCHFCHFCRFFRFVPFLCCIVLFLCCLFCVALYCFVLLCFTFLCSISSYSVLRFTSFCSVLIVLFSF